VDTTTDQIDVATAAARLGISQDAVWKRIRRGRLTAYRTDGRTYVVLDGASVPTDTTDGHARRVGGQSTDAEAAKAPDGVSSFADPGVSRELVAQLQSEVAFLRAELQARHQEISELHVLLRERPALPEPNSATMAELSRNDSEKKEVENPGNDSEGSRPWWQRWAWWRRADAP
jgi:excisionase family DNA binding protein